MLEELQLEWDLQQGNSQMWAKEYYNSKSAGFKYYKLLSWK